MQIPVIQKPAVNQRSRDTGARPLSAQANAGAFMAPGQATAALGKTIQGEAQSWGAIYTKISANKENAAAQGALKSEIEKARISVQHIDDPVAAMAEFNRQVQPQLKRMQSNGYRTADGSVLSFSTGTSRRAFNQTAATLMADAGATVRQVSRQRMVSSAIAKTYAGIDEAVKEIARMPEGIRRDVDIEFRVNKPLRQLLDVGHLDAEQHLKESRRVTQRLARLQVEKFLVGAEKPEQARQVFNDINSGKYPDLSATAAQDLSERAQRLQDSLRRKSNAEVDRTARLLKSERTKRHRTTFRELFMRVNDEDSPLSFSEVEKNFGNDNIDTKQREALRKAIEDKDSPLIENKAEGSKALDDVRKAQTRDDVQTLVDAAFARDDLTIETKMQIYNFAQGRLSKTPDARREILFRDTLEALAKPNSILDKLMPGSGAKAAAVVQRYNAAVADGDPPLEAFQTAVDALSDGRKATLSSLPKPMFGIEGRDLKDYTPDDVAATIAETKRRLKGKTSTFAIEWVYLKTLETYVNAMTPEERKAQDARIKKLIEEAKEVNKPR